MKYHRTPAGLVVTAETATEIESLSKWVITQTNESLKQALGAQARAVKPHKKHQYKKSCPECGKEFKGLIGIGIHRAKAHGVPQSIKRTSKGNLDCPHCEEKGFNKMGLSVHKYKAHGGKPQQISLFGETASI